MGDSAAQVRLILLWAVKTSIFSAILIRGTRLTILTAPSPLMDISDHGQMRLAGRVDSLVMISALTEEAHAQRQTNVLPAHQHNLVKPIVQGDLKVRVWRKKWTSDMVLCLLGHNLTCFAATTAIGKHCLHGYGWPSLMRAWGMHHHCLCTKDIS